MIAKSWILENLEQLNQRYLKAKTAKDAQYFAKLAIIELCGWIEVSMDHIVLSYAMRNLAETSNRTYCEGDIVKRTYGFDYNGHFRMMLVKTMGLVAVERLERRMDPAIRQRLISALSSLKQQRDAEAHTYLKGMTRTLNAPSVTISQFLPVYNGLVEFHRLLKLKRW